MLRLIALATFTVASTLGLSASAVTVVPLFGSAGQTAEAGAYFARPVGVVVRDDQGRPIEGAAVYFQEYEVSGSNAGIGMQYLDRPHLQFAGSVVTDRKGVAAARVIASTAAGGDVMLGVRTFVGRAVIPHLISLKVLPPRPPYTLSLHSGGGQTLRPQEYLGEPWKVRLVDGEGRPVANAAIPFSGGGLQFEHFWSWDWAMTDSNGVATSPPLHAYRGPIGSGEGQACFELCVSIPYEVVDWPAPGSAYFVSEPPPSIEIGKEAISPYVVKVIAADGRDAVGVPVTFQSLAPEYYGRSLCGWFEFDTAATVFTNSQGLAISPLYSPFGSMAHRTCTIEAEIGGMAFGEELTVYSHAYGTDRFRLLAPASVRSQPGKRFTVKVSIVTEDYEGTLHPVFGKNVEVAVQSVSGGAFATTARSPRVSNTSSDITLDLLPNMSVGTYRIIVSSGSLRRMITVDQRR